MSIETVVSTMHESILILRFNKPNKKNAIDFDMCVHITNVLNDAAVNEKISMVVFTGTGDYYSSGFDVSYRNLPAGKLYIILEAYIKALITFPKLIIALVNGPAIGIAATTLALCDFVFASDNAYFYTPFTKLGVVAEGCSSVTFPRLMGERKAMNMLFLNYKMPATEALECGLISNLYKHEDFIQKSWDQIKEITNLNQNSVLFTKKLINRNKIELLLRTNEIEMKALLKLHELRKELYLLLGADPVNGLTSDKAKELLEYYGPNILTPSSHFKWPILLFKSLCTGFSILIWVGAVLCFGAYLIELSAKPDPSHDNLYLGCVLIGIDVICGLFSFFQNYKSCKIMKTFNSLIPMHTNCLRDGVLRSDIPVHDLVKGDIVFVELGDVIPADIRIIDSKGFKVDNSSLTGESVAVPRRDTEGTANILESQNVAFFSALCVEGWARGVVICCGDLTALGRVAGLAARLQPAPSPLSREIQRFMRCMSAWALGLGVVVAAASFSLGYPFIQTTIFVIGIIVANIPEGLQPTVTASLTLTAKRMVAKKCLVKNLDAIEALGACTTICSDKTGTLTENKMCVRHIWMWNKKYFVVDPDFKSTLQHNQGFVPLKMCGALCSNATVSKTGDVRGDASEKAILNFLLGFDEPMALREQFPKVAEIPFNSVNKFQISVHLDTSCSKYYLAMKGAPECILNRCTTLTHKNQNINMTNEIKEAAYKATEDLANTGERVLAFADLILDSNEYPINYEFNTEDINFPQENLRFLGLMGLIDPPREQVKSAIERVRAAGVRVMMVTGDHPATARAVALEVGIATNTCHVITGNELRNMTQDLLSLTLQKHYEIVFARTSPTQKLQIVEACQRQGNVVAVTGDGVNDAPALRRADIGISMGITGSQVSKQTADIILMDDNFATIVTGIEEGRKIFDNLKKSVCYILISNVPEILPVFMFILFSIPLPLGVMTILCVDLGTDMWPAVSLSHEQAEQDVMARPPRASEALVSPCMLILVYGHLGLIEFAAGMFAYFVVMSEHGFYPTDLFGIREKWDNAAISDVTDSLGQEWTYSERKELERICQAAYFVAVVITQMTNGIICKTRYNSFFQVGMKNKVLNVGLVFELGLACLVCYAPGVNAFLRTYPLRLRWWFLALPFAALMFMFDEFRKHCIRNQKFNGWFNRLTYY